jgi:hypothetical protein
MLAHQPYDLSQTDVDSEWEQRILSLQSATWQRVAAKPVRLTAGSAAKAAELVKTAKGAGSRDRPRTERERCRRPAPISLLLPRRRAEPVFSTPSRRGRRIGGLS